MEDNGLSIGQSETVMVEPNGAGKMKQGIGAVPQQGTSTKHLPPLGNAYPPLSQALTCHIAICRAPRN